NLYLYNLKSNETKEIPTDEGYVSTVAVSPDRKKLLFVHSGRTYENATHAKLYLFNLETWEKICLTEDLDAPIGDYVAADIQQQAVLQGVVWASDEDFYFPIS